MQLTLGPLTISFTVDAAAGDVTTQTGAVKAADDSLNTALAAILPSA